MKQHQQQFFFQPLGRLLLRVLPSPGFAHVLCSLLVLVLLGYCVAR